MQTVVADTAISYKFISLSEVFGNITTAYSPNTTDDNKNAFNNIVQNALVTQIKTYHNETLTPSVKAQVENQTVNTTFNGDYNYYFNGFSSKYQMDISQVQLNNSRYVII
mgnify:CR=1 FL=1